MTHETDVRTWFATAEVPDLRLDFEQTVRNGRTAARRRTVRRFAGTGALVLAAVLAVPGVVALAGRDNTDARPAARGSSPPDGPFTCTYQALPEPAGLDALDKPGLFVEIDRIDPSGRYIIGTAKSESSNYTMPVLWDNGVGRIISPQLEGRRPVAVSENGVVAGTRDSDGREWVFRDGQVTDILPPAGSSHILIWKINMTGDLLGIVYTEVPWTAKVAVWRAGDLANPEILAASAEATEPVAFLADGGVVGWQPNEQRPYVWNAQRQGRAFALPAGARDVRLTGAGDGWVYGVGRRSEQSGMVPIRWKVETGEAEWVQVPAGGPPVPDSDLRAAGENGALLFEGIENGSVPRTPSGKAYVVRGGHVAQLPSPNGEKTFVTGMDRYGAKVVGNVVTPQNNTTGVKSVLAVWTC